jgi:hypothetical protein
MADLKQHGTAAAVAAMVAATTQVAMPPKVVEKPVQVTIAASKHAWPDLSDIEKAALAARLTWAAGQKVQIFCDGSDCRDLQTDLDDAFEDAGVASERAIPINPLGYGFAVVYGVGDHGIASKLAGDITAATGGRLAPETKATTTEIDGIVIAIGKKPRQ